MHQKNTDWTAQVLIGLAAGWAIFSALKRERPGTPAPGASLDRQRLELEQQKFAIEVQKAEFEYVKQLYDYTKFHIGLYTGVITIFVALGKSDFINSNLKVQSLIWLGILFIGIAGLAGGVIASTLASFMRSGGARLKTLDTFLENNTGPFSWFQLKGQTWIDVEHRSFWVGAVTGLLAFVIPFLGTCAVTFHDAGRSFWRIADLAAILTTNFCQ